MRRRFLVMALLQMAGCAHGTEAAPIGGDSATSSQQATGIAFMEHLSRGEYAPAEAMFAPNMKSAFPAKALENLWTNTVSDRGAFLVIESTRVEPGNTGWQVLVTCRFERGPQTFNVVVDLEGRVSNLFPRAVIPVGRGYVWRLSRHEYDAAFALSDAQMQATASPAQLAKLWTSLEADNGAFHRIISVKNEGDATVEVAFADHAVTFSVCVDSRAKVCGFHIVKATKRSGFDASEPQLDFERQDGP